MENVGKRVGSRPGFGKIAAEIHLIVALQQAAEEESIDALRLRIGGKARVEIGGTGFDEEGERSRIGLIAAGAAGQRKCGKRKKKKKHGKGINAEAAETQRAQRRKERRNPTKLEGEISGAEHKIFYRGLRGRGRRLRKGGSQDVGDKFRRRARQRPMLPWRLRECRDAQRARLRCREERRRFARESSDFERHLRKR